MYGQQEASFVNKSFLIIGSTKKIADAYAIAKKASEKTHIHFQDNQLQANKNSGATFPADTCKAAGFEFPCYIARGRYDDGVYLSIEYSDAYSGFAKGLFIVVAANGDPNDKDLIQTLQKVKVHYPDSYIKQTKVYVGCMH
ncbi:hypothetical protein CNR22_14760 [Sphingobacteriaceae bacterium]|nr:hypothetical protein CNR22_14760 [Sphingobacteriaceae bacterium]